jgi:hypothetical protein
MNTHPHSHGALAPCAHRQQAAGACEFDAGHADPPALRRQNLKLVQPDTQIVFEYSADCIKVKGLAN